MRFLSLFSGIEAASAAWLPLGWECAAVAEIDAAPSKVLAARHPGVPNLGDITKITEADIAALGRIDVVVFGSPCQDLSLAGQRKGFDGARSGLFFKAIELIQWARIHGNCRFALWENVVGAFSSNEGRDFAAVVAEMAGLAHVDVPRNGWGGEGAAVGHLGLLEWSILDAQWFGVAQRRRRCFALADFGDWSNRPPILLERQSLRGDSAPSREAGQEAAGTLASRTDGGGFPETDEACSGYVQPVVSTLDASYGRLQGSSGQDANHGHSHLVPVAFGGNNQSGPIDVATARNASGGGDKPHALIGMAVRRLTPRECERLMGQSDDHTLVPVKKAKRRSKQYAYTEIDGQLWQLMADGPRYKMLGNSMVVQVMRWIGESIDRAVTP